MPLENLPRIAAGVIRVAAFLWEQVGHRYWRVVISILVAAVVVASTQFIEPSGLRTIFCILAAVGIPIEGIRWHLRSGD